MYLEGLESRAIGRLLEISYGTVYKWVRKSGQEQMLRQSKEAVEVVEMDELHTYEGNLYGFDNVAQKANERLQKRMKIETASLLSKKIKCIKLRFKRSYSQSSFNTVKTNESFTIHITIGKTIKCIIANFKRSYSQSSFNTVKTNESI